MNCNECKTLLGECGSLADLGQLPEVTAHLKDCAACRAVLLYEGKLRQGFAGIAGEAAPPDLAARIMAIQSDHAPEAAKSAESAAPGWFAMLLHSLQGFPFKVAIAAGLTGFFAAVLILHQPQLAPSNEPATITTQHDEKKQTTGRDETFQLAKTREQPLPASHNKSLQFDAPSDDAQHDSSDNGSMQLAIAPKEEAAAPKESPQIAESAEERIPGAVTFALDSSSDTFIADKAAGAAAVSLADEPDASEPEMQLAMSPTSERETAKPSAPTRFAAAPPAGEVHSRIAASQKISESRNKKLELGNELSGETQTADPLAEELRKLLEANAIDLPEGFISLDELAMRGYLPAEKLRRMRPPTGSGWYLQKAGGQLRIFLKKR